MSKAIPQPVDLPAPDVIQPTSPPPGGGSWKWDSATGQWIPNELQTENNPQE